LPGGLTAHRLTYIGQASTELLANAADRDQQSFCGSITNSICASG
jgi:hypothetical protein